MSSSKKVIKYLAIALAIIIIASIVSAIVTAVSSVIYLLDGNEGKSDNSYTFTADDINNLDIELAACDFEIKSGEDISVETDTDRVTVKQSGSTLKIHEQSRRVKNESHVTLTIPDKLFSLVELEMGAGVLDADSIRAERLDLELGAGEAVIDYLEVTKQSSINTGAGKFELKSGSLCSLDLEVGVGKAELCASLSGECDIECGVGELCLELMGSQDNYLFDIEKGLGSVEIGEASVSSGRHGSGDVRIDIKSGVGSVDIDFTE